MEREGGRRERERNDYGTDTLKGWERNKGDP
jgi:hypothetical protein